MSDQSHDSRDEGTTVAEASLILGISEGAVRKRVERGKLGAKHTRDGRLLVYLDRATTDTTRDRARQSRDERHEDRYTRSLEEQVAYLRSQLEQERAARTEERRRQDTVIAQLSRANEEQARTIRELEAPQEPAEDAETAAAPTGELGELREGLGTERTRREMAESTLHEGMAEEQHRREEAERERDNLRRELFALREPRQAPGTAEEQQGRAQPHSATVEAQEGVQRPWWRRVFGR